MTLFEEDTRFDSGRLFNPAHVTFYSSRLVETRLPASENAWTRPLDPVHASNEPLMSYGTSRVPYVLPYSSLVSILVATCRTPVQL